MHAEIIGYRRNGCPIHLIRGGSQPVVEPAPAAPAPAAYTPPATQEDLNRMIGERLNRERANFADYDALKAKAGQFDQLTEQQKTELQRAHDAAQAAEQRATTAEQRAARVEVAIAKGVPANLIAGSTQAEMEASADALLAFRGQVATTTTLAATPIPGFTPGQGQQKKAGSEAGRAEAARRFPSKQQ